MSNIKEQNSIYVTSPSLPHLNEYIDEIRSIFENKWITNMGEKHNELEKKLQSYLDVSFVSLVTNGHMALEIALQSLNMKRGGEIITTPFTFVSTTNAIVRAGFKPVFCDIKETDYTIDEKKIESLITDNTVAILPVHVYGNVCNVDEIQRIANRYELKVVYDAAHAFGVKYKDKGITNFGDISILSFHATKVFNSIEGGAICTNNPELNEKIYMMRDFGIETPESVKYVAPNAKMDEFRAAMGLCNLRRIKEDIEKRKKLFECYYNYLKNIEGIGLLNPLEYVQTNYAYFPVLINKEFGISRDDLAIRLSNSNIYVRKYFYPLISDLECYRNEHESKSTPIALKTSKNVLTLPLYADLEISDIKRICSEIGASKQ